MNLDDRAEGIRRLSNEMASSINRPDLIIPSFNKEAHMDPIESKRHAIEMILRRYFHPEDEVVYRHYAIAQEILETLERFEVDEKDAQEDAMWRQREIEREYERNAQAQSYGREEQESVS